MKSKIFQILSGLMLVAIVLGAVSQPALAIALTPAIVLEQTVTEPSGLSDPAEMEFFMDDLITSQLEMYDIAGAAVTVVKDGQLFFMKGYGYADVTNQIPVDPEKTIFRIGSISKLFTATAAMQLVEGELLDLDQDVNAYLTGFQIPATFDKPITIKNLLTHTTGLEDRHYQWFAPQADDLMSMEEWLRTHLPVRVDPPGEYISYSSYGMTLLGYIVEQVSGMPYDQYLEEYIFQPLGMGYTTARQPLPSELGALMSNGYFHAGGETTDFEWSQTVPAGGVSASAADMANFMLAHLNGGCSVEGCILQEVTARRMQETLFTHDPRVNGFAYGFIEYSRNGERIIGHGGNTFAFHSLLLLLPEHDTGIFVAYNSAGGYELTNGIFQNDLANHYFPVAFENVQPLAGFPERATRYAGIYRPLLRSYSTSEKLISLFDLVRVRVDGGALLVDTRIGPQRFFEFAPGFLRTLDGNDAMYIGDNGQGDSGYVFVNSAEVYALEKVRWYDSPTFNGALLVFVLLLCLSAFIAEPVRMLRARRQDQTRTAQPCLAVIARWIGLIAAGLSVVTMVCLYIFINDGLSIVLGTVPWRYPLSFLPLSTAILTAGAIVFTGLSWVKGYWTIGERGHYTLLTITLAGFVWFLYFWNVLLFRI